jgi:translation initiation factor 2B subunit (eIF-2B alpha/beta/delta family)
MVGGNVVVVVLSPPGGAIVVGTESVVAFTVVSTAGAVDVVHPARTRAKTTVAVTPSFRAMVVLPSTRSGPSPAARYAHRWW